VRAINTVIYVLIAHAQPVGCVIPPRRDVQMLEIDQFLNNNNSAKYPQTKNYESILKLKICIFTCPRSFLKTFYLHISESEERTHCFIVNKKIFFAKFMTYVKNYNILPTKCIFLNFTMIFFV